MPKPLAGLGPNPIVEVTSLSRFSSDDEEGTCGVHSVCGDLWGQIGVVGQPVALAMVEELFTFLQWCCLTWGAGCVCVWGGGQDGGSGRGRRTLRGHFVLLVPGTKVSSYGSC